MLHPISCPTPPLLDEEPTRRHDHAATLLSHVLPLLIDPMQPRPLHKPEYFTALAGLASIADLAACYAIDEMAHVHAELAARAKRTTLCVYFCHPGADPDAAKLMDLFDAATLDQWRHEFCLSPWPESKYVRFVDAFVISPVVASQKQPRHAWSRHKLAMERWHVRYV